MLMVFLFFPINITRSLHWYRPSANWHLSVIYTLDYVLARSLVMKWSKEKDNYMAQVKINVQ